MLCSAPRNGRRTSRRGAQRPHQLRLSRLNPLLQVPGQPTLGRTAAQPVTVDGELDVECPIRGASEEDGTRI